MSRICLTRSIWIRGMAVTVWEAVYWNLRPTLNQGDGAAAIKVTDAERVHDHLPGVRGGRSGAGSLGERLRTRRPSTEVAPTGRPRYLPFHGDI